MEFIRVISLLVGCVVTVYIDEELLCLEDSCNLRGYIRSYNSGIVS